MTECSDLCSEKPCPNEKPLSLYPLTLDEAVEALLKSGPVKKTRKPQEGSKMPRKGKKKVAA